jgi:hypothetical protein
MKIILQKFTDKTKRKVRPRNRTCHLRLDSPTLCRLRQRRLCRDDRGPMPLRVAVVTCVRADGRLRTNPLFDAREIVDNLRTPSPIFLIFFWFGFADASRAGLPRVRVRAPPATRSTTARVDWRFCRLAPRTAGGPAPTSPASEPLFRSGRNFPASWPTRRRVRPPSFVALRRRRPVCRRFRTSLPPKRRIFDFFPSVSRT